MPSQSNDSLIRTRQLQRNIALLANVEISEAPFVSCYLDLSEGADPRQFLERRKRELRESMNDLEAGDLDRAMAPIDRQLQAPIGPGAQGLALFSRGLWGGRFFLSMQSAVPFANHLGVYPSPDIYPLLELKDTYDRFLLVLVRTQGVQIAEINLGAASTRAWARSAESGNGGLDDAVGEPGVSLSATQTDLSGYARLVERLAIHGGRMRLIVAGSGPLARRLVECLPAPLASRVIETLDLPETSGPDEAIELAIRCFVEFEEIESRQITARLLRHQIQGTRAVTGSLATLRALRQGRADTLVIVGHYQSEPAWICNDCGSGRIEVQPPEHCTECGSRRTQALDLRVEMVRLAAQQGVAVEVVNSGARLQALGGVGCLLTDLADRGSGPLPEALDRLRNVA